MANPETRREPARAPKPHTPTVLSPFAVRAVVVHEFDDGNVATGIAGDGKVWIAIDGVAIGHQMLADDVHTLGFCAGFQCMRGAGRQAGAYFTGLYPRGAVSYIRPNGACDTASRARRWQ